MGTAGDEGEGSGGGLGWGGGGHGGGENCASADGVADNAAATHTRAARRSETDMGETHRERVASVTRLKCQHGASSRVFEYELRLV